MVKTPLQHIAEKRLLQKLSPFFMFAVFDVSICRFTFFAFIFAVLFLVFVIGEG